MPVYKNRFFLDQKYAKERLSIRQIAELTFSSKETIREALIRFEIPLRERGQHHGHPAQLKYGRRLVHGREIIHKAEVKIMDQIQDMRDEGLSLREIGQRLDLAGIQTKEGCKKWYPEMIRRITRK